MKPYKGIVEVACKKKKGCLRNLHKDVQPGCIDCPKAETRVVDLDGNPLFVYRSPEAKTGKRTKKQA